MTISEKVAYLKGLAEGLDLDTAKSKEGKLISVMIGILEEIGMSIEDLEENTVALGEEIDAISDDLSDVEKAAFDEDDDDEGDQPNGVDHQIDVETVVCTHAVAVHRQLLHDRSRMRERHELNGRGKHQHQAPRAQCVDHEQRL